MSNKLIKLILFELNKNIFHSINWLSNTMFLLINIAIFPFTVNPNPTILNQLFLSAIITSILLGTVLMTNNIFDEDAKDGTLDQYLTFDIPMYTIYLSKVIAVSIEFISIITIIVPLASLLYSIPLDLILKIWVAITLAIPLLTSISIFGSMITINLAKNSAISIILIFPLLISTLIPLSLALKEILTNKTLTSGIPYIEINLGLTMLLIPVICFISKILYK